MHTSRIRIACLAAFGSFVLACSSGGVTLPVEEPADTGTPAPSETGGAETSADAQGETTVPADGALDTLVEDAPASETSAEVGPTDGGSPDTGVVADVGTDAGPKACTATGGGCGPTEYCDAPSCGAGLCKPRLVTKPEYNPVCGCDGVSYWNREYASSVGASTRGATGECGSVDRKACGGLAGAKCPHTTDKCIEERSGSLGCTVSDGQGTCWAWPSDATCMGVIGFGGQFKRCSGGSGKCINKCEAIKDEKPFFLDATCPI